MRIGCEVAISFMHHRVRISMYKRDITQFQSFDFGRLLPTIASGALANLTFLGLAGNQIGDAGMSEFSRAIASGSLGALKVLLLSNNQIGDDGMKAFSDAIASGSLPKLAKVLLFGKPVNGFGVNKACSARGIECHA